MDFRMTGSLRTVVVSANGFRSCGSRCTADSTTIRTSTAATAPTIPASDPILGRFLGMRAMVFPHVVRRYASATQRLLDNSGR